MKWAWLCRVMWVCNNNNKFQIFGRFPLGREFFPGFMYMVCFNFEESGFCNTKLSKYKSKINITYVISDMSTELKWFTKAPWMPARILCGNLLQILRLGSAGGIIGSSDWIFLPVKVTWILKEIHSSWGNLMLLNGYMLPKLN